MSIGTMDNRTGDHIATTTQAEAQQLIIDKLRWHLSRKPDLTVSEIMELLKVCRSTAKNYRRKAREVQP